MRSFVVDSIGDNAHGKGDSVVSDDNTEDPWELRIDCSSSILNWNELFIFLQKITKPRKAVWCKSTAIGPITTNNPSATPDKSSDPYSKQTCVIDVKFGVLPYLSFCALHAKSHRVMHKLGVDFSRRHRLVS